MAEKQNSNVYPINIKSKQLNKDLDNFHQWVAAKKNLQLRPKYYGLTAQHKLTPDSLRPAQKIENSLHHSFFNPRLRFTLPELVLKGFKQQNLPEQKDNNLNMACDNCNELGHNSVSCPKPSPKSKR